MTAQRYGQRPSAMLGIMEPYAAYCFDTALAYRMRMTEAPKPRKAEVKGKASGMTISNGMLMGSFRGVIGDVN